MNRPGAKVGLHKRFIKNDLGGSRHGSGENGVRGGCRPKLFGDLIYKGESTVECSNSITSNEGIGRSGSRCPISTCRQKSIDPPLVWGEAQNVSGKAKPSWGRARDPLAVEPNLHVELCRKAKRPHELEHSQTARDSKIHDESPVSYLNVTGREGLPSRLTGAAYVLTLSCIHGCTISDK